MSNRKNSQWKYRKSWAALTCVIVITLLLSGCAGAQQPQVYRVGILAGNPSFAAIGDGFKAKMTELGYVENQNIIYITQNPTSDPAELQRQARKLVDDKVDLIFTFPAPESIAAHTATQGTNVPVVFAYAQLEGNNLVKSVSEPGGNMTGVRYPGPEMIGKRLDILHEIAPNVKRVWISYDKNGPNIPVALDALRLAALSLGIKLVEVPVATEQEFGADLAARAQTGDLGLDAILTMPDEFNTSPAGFAVLNKFAAEHKLPLAGGIAFMAEQGALFVNTTSLTNVGQLAAPLADKILKGAAPGAIMVVTPEQTLIINYKVAQELGLTVPEGLLKQASEIIR
ncbi:MAG: ABC transporter substrate-binding protein [Anaerolineales bacterium]